MAPNLSLTCDILLISTTLNLETDEIVEDNDINYEVRCSFRDYISKVLFYTKQPLLLY